MEEKFIFKTYFSGLTIAGVIFLLMWIALIFSNMVMLKDSILLLVIIFIFLFEGIFFYKNNLIINKDGIKEANFTVLWRDIIAIYYPRISTIAGDHIWLGTLIKIATKGNTYYINSIQYFTNFNKILAAIRTFYKGEIKNS